MKAPQDIVFLLDVDTTLLDNDRIVGDLRSHLEREFGNASAGNYWAIFEKVRAELGYADYLGALQRYRSDTEFGLSCDPRLLQMSSFLFDYPFAELRYPRALDVIEHLSAFGPTVILSDGDVVFQRRKIQRSGLSKAVDERVLVYVHKKQMLDSVECQYQGRHNVMLDDKLRVLASMKALMQERLATVFPRQGHYALDTAILATYPAADFTVERIGDLVDFELHTLLGFENAARAAKEKL